MGKTTFYITAFLVFFSFWGYSQNGAQKQYAEIPASYQSHPELGKTTHSATLNEVDYELIQQRTEFSRTFLNKNKTKTTLQSSSPLHYLGDDGFWHTIDYKLSRSKNT
ncbi:MAG: hypothetical protein EOO48_11435, partial [Flavobacterium sp.]